MPEAWKPLKKSKRNSVQPRVVRNAWCFSVADISLQSLLCHHMAVSLCGCVYVPASSCKTVSRWIRAHLWLSTHWIAPAKTAQIWSLAQEVRAYMYILGTGVSWHLCLASLVYKTLHEKGLWVLGTLQFYDLDPRGKCHFVITVLYHFAPTLSLSPQHKLPFVYT
jgi:hypothetical protein